MVVIVVEMKFKLLFILLYNKFLYIYLGISWNIYEYFFFPKNFLIYKFYKIKNKIIPRIFLIFKINN